MSSEQEPVARAVEDKDGVFDVDLSFSLMEGRCVSFSKHGPASIVPLYRSLTLTDEEREAVDGVAAFLLGLSDTGVQAGTCQVLRQHAATLRKMLERLA